MKKAFFLLTVMAGSLLIGCSSTPVALAPVGPNPLGNRTADAMGNLQVYSSLVGRVEGDNPTWFQHTDYEICGLHGNELKRVDNTVAYYEQAPPQVPLPPGRYLVKAQAQDYFRVSVPVEIESGRTTRVHLDDNWKPPRNMPKSELVRAPDGNAIGWRAEPPQTFGIN